MVSTDVGPRVISAREVRPRADGRSGVPLSSLLSPRTLLELFRSPRDDRPVQLLEPGRGSPIAVPLTLFAIIEAKKRGPVLYF